MINPLPGDPSPMRLTNYTFVLCDLVRLDGRAVALGVCGSDRVCCPRFGNATVSRRGGLFNSMVMDDPIVSVDARVSVY